MRSKSMGADVVTFDEGVEREVTFCVDPSMRSIAVPIAFAAEERIEPLHDAAGNLRGRILRRRWALHGSVTVDCEPVVAKASLCKLRVRIANASAVVEGERSSALRTAFVSTHTLLNAERGRFLSVLDPPHEAETETARWSIGTRGRFWSATAKPTRSARRSCSPRRSFCTTFRRLRRRAKAIPSTPPRSTN